MKYNVFRDLTYHPSKTLFLKYNTAKQEIQGFEKEKSDVNRPSSAAYKAVNTALTAEMHTKAMAEPPRSCPGVCSLVFTLEANTNTARKQPTKAGIHKWKWIHMANTGPMIPQA